MYKTKNFTKDDIAWLKDNNKEFYDDLQDVIEVSQNYTADDEFALRMDSLIYDWLQENKPKDNPKPKPKKTEPKKTEPKKPTKKPGKSREQLLSDLLDEIANSQDQSVNAEEVEAIVNSVMNSRKVCFEDLCAELTEAIKSSQKIKIRLPEYETKEFDAKTPNLLRLIDDVCMGNNVMLIGGAGTGKTYLAEQVAKIMELNTQVINCNQFTSPIEINGGQTIEGYQEGKLIKAWENGDILILDELPKLDPNTAGILNEALAKTAEPEDSDRAIIENTRGDKKRKKKGFGVIATGNVYPNSEDSAYGANNKQDLSLLDRFTGSVYEIEKNPEFEKELLQGYLFVWAIADRMRSVIERNRWEAQISIRSMESMLRSYRYEMKAFEKGDDMSKRKTYKDAVDSFIWTFTEVQQTELKREIQYDKYFSKYQYRKTDIDKNPFA